METISSHSEIVLNDSPVYFVVICILQQKNLHSNSTASLSLYIIIKSTNQKGRLSITWQH